MRIHHRPVLAVATAVAALGLVGCSKTVPADDLETQVARLAGEQGGLDVESVDCPDALPAEVDASVACTVVEPDGTEHQVDVTAISVAGDEVRFNVVEQ